MSDAEVQRLRGSLAEFAKEAGDWPIDHGSSFSPDACRSVFAAAEVEIPEARFDAVARAFRQMPFYGGNYTLDARRLLSAVGAARVTPPDDEETR